MSTGGAVISPDLKKEAFHPSVVLRPRMASASLTSFSPPPSPGFLRISLRDGERLRLSDAGAGEPPLPAPRPPPGHAAAFGSSGCGSSSLSQLQRASERETRTWICLPRGLQAFTCSGVARAGAGGTHVCFSPASPLRKPPALDAVTPHPYFTSSLTSIVCLASKRIF